MKSRRWRIAAGFKRLINSKNAEANCCRESSGLAGEEELELLF
jgi:hypothetical protein